VWRVKKTPLGSPGNTRPDYQQLLTGIELVMWIDSTEEQAVAPTLEERVCLALDQPRRVDRFGGLSLGESTHLVDEVRRLRPTDVGPARAFLLAERGRLSLPVWVDHVGSAGTRYVTGEIVTMEQLSAPSTSRIARIESL
jgi:CRISPR-associated protein Cas5t